MPDQQKQSEAVENIILRFRDLVTGPGDTVERHNAISRAGSYVWWGWWHKLGEQVPANTFGILLRRIRDTGDFRLMLLDSGQNKLYEAACTCISSDPARATIPSPDPNLTPAYYQSEKYLAWFKLGQITELDPSRINELSCVRVDEFFAENRSHYDEFYGKRIHSVAELQQQNRTIWFVRASRPEDPSHLVQLLDANRISPSDFPDRVLVTERDRFLWVSDLHFSVDDKHGFPLNTDDTRRELWNALHEAVKEEPALAGAFISGDLTWKGEQSEYEQFGSFIRNMLSETKWDNNYFITVCPGNHDLTFSQDRAAEGADPGRVVAAKREAYEKAYNAIFYLRPNQFLCNGRRYVLKEGIPVEVVALNSSLLQQTEITFQGHGFIGEPQLTYAAEKMKWRAGEAAENGAFRIVILHHHLLPVTYRERASVDARSSIVFDANAVIEWIAKHNVDLAIHGHQHQPFCAKLSYPLRSGGRPEGSIERWHDFHVVGLGSTGVTASHLGETKVNTYGLLVFSREGVDISVRAIDPGRTYKSGELWSLHIPFQRLVHA